MRAQLAPLPKYGILVAMETCVKKVVGAAAIAVAALMQADGGVSRSQEDGMDMMVLSNKYGSVTVSLMGAQIRSYRPAGMKEDLLFAPKTMAIDGTKHVHGGIPVCWPWFGRNGEPGSPLRPNHGQHTGMPPWLSFVPSNAIDLGA